MNDDAHQTGTETFDDAPSSTLVTRLHSRLTASNGLIDVRHAQQHYARLTQWIARRFPLLGYFQNRYALEGEAATNSHALVMQQQWHDEQQQHWQQAGAQATGAVDRYTARLSPAPPADGAAMSPMTNAFASSPSSRPWPAPGTPLAMPTPFNQSTHAPPPDVAPSSQEKLRISRRSAQRALQREQSAESDMPPVAVPLHARAPGQSRDTKQEVETTAAADAQHGDVSTKRSVDKAEASKREPPALTTGTQPGDDTARNSNSAATTPSVELHSAELHSASTRRLSEPQFVSHRTAPRPIDEGGSVINDDKTRETHPSPRRERASPAPGQETANIRANATETTSPTPPSLEQTRRPAPVNLPLARELRGSLQRQSAADETSSTIMVESRRSDRQQTAARAFEIRDAAPGLPPMSPPGVWRAGARSGALPEHQSQDTGRRESAPVRERGSVGSSVAPAATGQQQMTPPASTATRSTQSSVGEADIKHITEQVISVISRRFAVERERRGGRS